MAPDDPPDKSLFSPMTCDGYALSRNKKGTFSHSSGLMHRPVRADCAVLGHIYTGSAS